MDKTNNRTWAATLRSGRTLPAAAVRLAGLGSAVALALSGCSVDVRDPAAPVPVVSSPGLATPTITPGHDAAAVAAADMPFSAGGTLAKGVPVGLSDGLKEAPGWTVVKDNVAGGSQYQRADGCLVAATSRANQWPLVSTDDHASTVALFKYLDPTILPEYLSTFSLRWGGDADKPGPAVEVLQLERPPAGAARPTALLARLFGTAGSSIYVSITCNDAGALASARTDVQQRLLVVPPG
ncbi:hypothetical protein V1639_06015 [Pseudarthrobacter sp. J75]|uniref:hypothetical protein n=1 Tax=unclassified Pseudarthrobacter TaxID=2647000 RepID=UPI002E816C3E|nr:MULTISPECIES: hypothetical protein [unclassified Pseudarthrobacter]MEE2521352.1 hypothetical protein [Pseudarthrobacter sp. J47]MEE2528584.1 hypothetical protein [Pseudarthrobacter sp. J75]